MRKHLPAPNCGKLKWPSSQFCRYHFPPWQRTVNWCHKQSPTSYFHVSKCVCVRFLVPSWPDPAMGTNIRHHQYSGCVLHRRRYKLKASPLASPTTPWMTDWLVEGGNGKWSSASTNHMCKNTNGGGVNEHLTNRLIFNDITLHFALWVNAVDLFERRWCKVMAVDWWRINLARGRHFDSGGGCPARDDNGRLNGF